MQRVKKKHLKVFFAPFRHCFLLDLVRRGTWVMRTHTVRACRHYPTRQLPGNWRADCTEKCVDVRCRNILFRPSFSSVLNSSSAMMWGYCHHVYFNLRRKQWDAGVSGETPTGLFKTQTLTSGLFRPPCCTNYETCGWAEPRLAGRQEHRDRAMFTQSTQKTGWRLSAC